MEIERPKYKKKKKIRQLSEDEELEAELRNLSLDIDFPQSSVESREQITKAEQSEDPQIELFDSPNSSNEAAEEEECDDNAFAIEQESDRNEVFPSAPDIEFVTPETPKSAVPSSVHTTFLCDQMLYPDLGELKKTPTVQIVEKILSPTAIKAFSPLQMEQLYTNNQLRLVEIFEGEFVEKELKDSLIQDHPLYTLLKKYSKSRAKYRLNQQYVNQVTKTCEDNYKNVWKIESRTVFGHGHCRCGTAVRGSHDFQQAIFSEEVNNELDRNLKELLRTSCYEHTKCGHDAALYHMQIEQMIRELLNHKSFTHVPNDSPVTLNDEVVYQDMRSKIGDLRLYISILFKFLREANSDKCFTTDVKEWVTKLVSLQLRVATWHDHVFILFHILRCPAGIGSWAANLIQAPVMQRLADELHNPFTFPEFNHCVSLLSALLLPIKDRSTFLESITKDLAPNDDSVQEDIWILVDSDGEEGSSPSGECIGLKENDLVAIFDQIPLEMIFRYVTMTQKTQQNEYQLDENKITGHHIIRTIAFASKFIGILKNGLVTYDTERYKQFAKRLGRLMKHTVFYIGDMMQLYNDRDGYKDLEETQRIQVEFDELIVRSAHFIYKSKKLSLFQYLADFPYHLVSTKSLWKLYYYLHVGDFKIIEEDISRLVLDESFSMKFNDELATDDLYFLLHAFAQMALAKEREDWDLIQFITIDLLQIGFINENTKDHCYGTAKDLLSNITNKYPELIADVFSYLKDNLHKAGSLSAYLCKALPIAKWIPKTEELEVLATWLLNFDFDCIENVTARIIFAYMNWNFNENDELFLPHEIHVRVAHLVCEVYMKHINESIGSGVSETARQVCGPKKNQSKKEQFSTWCWSMISVLRLHYMDLNKQAVRSLMENASILNLIPELEETRTIYQGFVDQKPLAIYLSLLLSQLGHSIPQICHRGFEQMKFLLNDYRHSKVIRCLELITPLFINCQSSLYSCETFMSILSAIFSADKTYAKISKEALVAEPRGPVLVFFANMIQHQLCNYSRYGWSSPSNLVQLWINCLIRLKEWNKDPGIIWILDIICQLAYQYTEAWTFARELLRPTVVKIADTKISKSSGLLNLMTSEEKDILLSPSEDALTLSLLLLELEFENIEMNTGLWSEFLCQLVIQGRTPQVNVLKRSLGLKQLPNFPLQSLVIYKLAKLISKAPHEHFLFPILCQQFFSLYLSRVPGDVSVDDYGVQDKFYEADIGLMKKIKKSFQDADKYHHEMSLKTTKFRDGIKSRFHDHCSKIFKTFVLWLEENQINRMTQQNIILPPQYDHERIKEIFRGNRDHWTEFIFLIELRAKIKRDCDSWLTLCLRYLQTTPPKAKQVEEENKKSENIKRKIFDRLKVYGKPLEPPELIREPPYIGSIDLTKSTLQLLRNESKILQNFARKFNMTINEHKAIDANYKEYIRYIYSNESTHRVKSVTCSRIFENCEGAANIRLDFSEMKVHEQLKSKLEDNRQFQRQMLTKEADSPDLKVIDANFCMQNVIQQLLELYENHQKRGDKDQCDAILKIGTSFFYDILKEINEDIQNCPVTQELYHVSISQLGSLVQQNQNTEGVNLLNLALQQPNLVNLIAELFTPSVSSPQYFLEMYKMLVDSYAKRCDPQLLFVLFSKFDIPRWLALHKPKLIDVSNFIQLLLRALELWNHQNSDLLQDLLRCHLVNLFEYRFPEHYGEILQNVLVEFGQQRIKSNVLLDLLNSFYQRVGCTRLTTEESISKLKDDFRNFASKQNILMYNDVHSTTLMLAHHFYNERLQYGLHGLYPKYSEYCDVLCLLMGSIGHSVVASAIQAFPGIMADQLINWLFPALSEMFAPWLIPYTPQNIKDTPANWIKQFSTANNVLQPWSDVHVTSAGKMIRIFAMCLQYILDMLPASNLLLSHLFCWYDTYFAQKTTPSHVLTPIHTLLMKMPWERFRPSPIHMEGLNRILMDYIPECHLFIGNIFLRISWTPWLQQNINSWDYSTMQRMLAILLMIFVKLSYEPKVRESIRIVTLLQDAVKYPWHLLEYKDVESVLDWFVMSTEPSVILKIPSEHETIDACVLNLLQSASSMKDTTEGQNIQQTVVTAKRMAYVRSVVRLLKGCDAKLHQLMSTKQGQEMFHQTFRALLNSIDSCFPTSDDRKTMDAVNLMIPVLQNISVPESAAKLFAESIELWQLTSQTGNIVLKCTLNALRVQTIWSLNVYRVLDSTLANYMRVSELSPHYNPTWPDAHQRFGLPQADYDQKQLIDNDLFLALHILSYNKLLLMKDDCARVTFIQELQTQLGLQKTTEASEAKMALMWGFTIMSGGHIMKRSNMSKNQLLAIARHFQVTSAQPEGWGEGLLGAIGLKRDGQTNKKKILARCLSCAIFALFSGSTHDPNVIHSSAEYEMAMTELKNVLSNKKFADVRTVGLQAIALIENKSQSMLDDLMNTVGKLIKIFYQEHYLNSIEYLYHW